MSVQATSWVWEHSNSEGVTRLVALAVADAANREGRRSCQSVKSIAAMVRVSERTVQRSLRWLEEAGEVVAEGTDPRYGTTSYWLPGCQRDTPPASVAPGGDKAVSPLDVEGVTKQGGGGDKAVSPNPSNPITTTTPHSPSVSTSPEPPPDESTHDERFVKDDDGFEEFWRAFPRKERQVVTRAAYRHALETTDPNTLLAGAKGYARKITRDGTEPRYIQTADRWLREERWTDDYAAPRADRPWYHVAE